MKLSTPGRNSLLFALIAINFSIQITTINAFSITLSCNAPCTDLTETGIPADGIIHALWSDLQSDTISFGLRWASPSNVIKGTGGAQLFSIDTTEYTKENADYPGNGSATLKIPQMYIPPGDYYYITVLTPNGFPILDLGPYSMNEAYSSYPVPRQHQKYNFTVNLCPTDNESCNGSNFTHNPDDYLTVLWSLIPNVNNVQKAQFTLWWGNPTDYGTIPYFTGINNTINNTLWYGEWHQDIPSRRVELAPYSSQILFDNYPPPGSSYYVGVYLEIPPETIGTGEYKYYMAFSRPFTMLQSRSHPIEKEEGGSGFANPMYSEVLLFVPLITLYLCV